VGSAPLDFVLITMPTTLVMLPILGLFGLAQNQIALGQRAYEIARFSALADVNADDIASLNKAQDSTATISRRVYGGRCVVEVSVSKTEMIFGWPTSVPLTATAEASCELDQ